MKKTIAAVTVIVMVVASFMCLRYMKTKETDTAGFPEYSVTEVSSDEYLDTYQKGVIFKYFMAENSGTEIIFQDEEISLTVSEDGDLIIKTSNGRKEVLTTLFHELYITPEYEIYYNVLNVKDVQDFEEDVFVYVNLKPFKITYKAKKI